LPGAGEQCGVVDVRDVLQRRSPGDGGAMALQGGGELLGAAVHRERSEEHTSELQSRFDLVCRLLLEKKKGVKRRAATEKRWVWVASVGGAGGRGKRQETGWAEGPAPTRGVVAGIVIEGWGKRVRYGE